MLSNRLQIALVGISGLSAASLLWGSVLLQAPPRSHLAALVAVVGASAVFLVRADRSSLARWTGGALALVVFLAAIVLGGYDHLLRVVLVGHGIASFGSTGDWLYETLGIALLPLGAAGLTTLKVLAPKKDEE